MRTASGAAELMTGGFFIVGNGGMGFWDYYMGGLKGRDYHRDPFSPIFPKKNQGDEMRGLWRGSFGVLKGVRALGLRELRV